MKNDIINLLNLQQSKIIESTDKKIIVSAGPGSGKTYTIVKKIKKELSENDYSIIITSFTKEAANQLKNKLRNTCDLGDSYVGTLYSFVLVEIIDKFKNRYLSARGLKEVSKLKYSMPKRNSEIEELTRIGINPSTIKRIQLCLKKWLNDFSNGKYEISSLTYLIAIDLMNKCPVAKKYISETSLEKIWTNLFVSNIISSLSE